MIKAYYLKMLFEISIRIQPGYQRLLLADSRLFKVLFEQFRSFLVREIIKTQFDISYGDSPASGSKKKLLLFHGSTCFFEVGGGANF